MEESDDSGYRQRRTLQEKLVISLKLIKTYSWLIDSYVLDFYTNNHWNRLPFSWTECFSTKEPEDFVELINSKNVYTKIWPLSILCVKTLINELSLPRAYESNDNSNELLSHPKMKHIFVKNLNPKKRHEVYQMSQKSINSAEKVEVRNIIDFGAGLGHLSRALGYGYNLKMICLEMQEQLNREANILDQHLEKMHKKFLPGRKIPERPNHISLKLTEDLTSNELLEKISCCDKTFGIIGLHPCGDLSPILMKLFVRCDQARFLNIVGCCFMKLSESNLVMSRFLRSFDKDFSHLSYESREIACHAIELYKERLEKGDYKYLKIHSFRAAVEEIIVKYWPHLRHSGLRSVKHSDDMTFEKYCNRAVSNLHITIPQEHFTSPRTMEHLERWKQVVIFYTLRLMFAPLIESVIHYDRQLYLLEQNCQVDIIPIFEPRLSPRNHLIQAFKKQVL